MKKDSKKFYTKMFSKYPDVLSIRDVQTMLGIGKNSAYQLVNANKIRHTKIGRKIIIAKISLINYLTENAQ